MWLKCNGAESRLQVVLSGLAQTYGLVSKAASKKEVEESGVQGS